MHTPALTVVTVTYNCRSTIESTIDSVQNQHGADFNHLVIDGGSTDGTLEIVRAHHHIQTISEPDDGIYDAMNKGIRLASGDIIGFLNGDDIYQDGDVLRTVIEAFARDPQLDIVYGDLVYISADGTNRVVRNWVTGDYYPDFFDDGKVPPHPSLFVRRSVLMDTDGFDTSFRIAADYELMFRLMKIEGRRSRYIPSTFVRMRLGGASNKSLRNVRRGNAEVIRSWGKHGLRIPLKFWIKRYAGKIGQFFH